MTALAPAAGLELAAAGITIATAAAVNLDCYRDDLRLTLLSHIVAVVAGAGIAARVTSAAGLRPISPAPLASVAGWFVPSMAALSVGLVALPAVGLGLLYRYRRGLQASIAGATSLAGAGVDAVEPPLEVDYVCLAWSSV